MKREEAEKLIAAFEGSTTIGMSDLLALARLGAYVSDPTAEEIEAMEDAYDREMNNSGETWPAFRCALAAFKDRAHG